MNPLTSTFPTLATLFGQVSSIDAGAHTIQLGGVSVHVDICEMPSVGAIVCVHAKHEEDRWVALSIQKEVGAKTISQRTPSEVNTRVAATTGNTDVTTSAPAMSRTAPAPKGSANRFDFSRKESAPPRPKVAPSPRSSTFNMPTRPVVPATPVKRPATPVSAPAQAPTQVRASGGFLKAPVPASPTSPTRSTLPRVGAFGRSMAFQPEDAAPMTQGAIEPAREPRGTLNTRPRPEVLKEWCLDDAEVSMDIPF